MTQVSKSVSRFSLIEWTILAVLFILYFALFTSYSFNPFQKEDLDLVFNDMILRLSRGDFTIDPKIILAEAYVRDGRTYAYFGVTPAVARLAFLPFIDLRTTSVSAIICTLLAFAISVLNYVSMSTAAGFPKSSFLRNCFFLMFLFSGLPLYLAGSHAIYIEVTLWALFFAAMFIYSYVRYRSSGHKLKAYLISMAVCAGLCLNTRVTTGAMLSAAWVVVFLHGLSREPWRGRWPNRLMSKAEIYAGLALSAFTLLALYVNYERWGSPLEFADITRQIYQQHMHPERAVILHRYGAFNFIRAPFGVQYYFFPVWGLWGSDHVSILNSFMQTYMHGAEFPPASLVLTDALLVWLAGLYLVKASRGLAQRLTDRRPIRASADLIVWACFAPIPVLMLSHIYMALRYRIEFFPFIFFGAWLAVRNFGSEAFWRRHRNLVLGLTLLSIAASLVTLRISRMPPGSTVNMNLPAEYMTVLRAQSRPVSD